MRKKPVRRYHPHEGERMEALAGLPLAPAAAGRPLDLEAQAAVSSR